MKRIVLKRDNNIRIFLSDADGFYKSLIHIPMHRKASLPIKNDIIMLKYQLPNGNIKNDDFWELVTPIHGRKYVRVDNNNFDVVSVSDIIENKNEVKPVAFDGIDLSNTENLDSGFDGFFE